MGDKKISLFSTTYRLLMVLFFAFFISAIVVVVVTVIIVVPVYCVIKIFPGLIPNSLSMGTLFHVFSARP